MLPLVSLGIFCGKTDSTGTGGGGETTAGGGGGDDRGEGGGDGGRLAEMSAGCAAGGGEGIDGGGLTAATGTLTAIVVLSGSGEVITPVQCGQGPVVGGKSLGIRILPSQ